MFVSSSRLKIPKKKKKEKKGEVNQDAWGAEGVSKVEVTTKKSKKKKNSLDKTDNMEEDSKNKNDEKGEVDQNALGAEGVSKVEVKTKKSKKKKISFDQKTDDIEEKDDVSLPRIDEEPEFDREKLETSLSSSAEKDICVSSKAHKRVREGFSSEDMNAAGKKPKKLIPERLWSVEDELILLQGIVGFNETTGKSTNEDKNGFYEFIKEYISIEVSFSQCIAKIGSVRRKYLNKVAKGKIPSSSKAQDLEAFELSETIWGSVSESRRSEKIKKLEEDKDVMIQGGDWFSSSVLVSWVVNFGMDEVSVKRLWGCVSAEKKKKMLDRWKVLQAKDVESASQKSEFLNDVVSLIVEEASSSH